MERMPSLDLVLDRLDDERDRQLTHFEGQDTKAGVLLGFSGVLVALRPTGQSALVLTGVVLSAFAAVAALTVLWPRRFPAQDGPRLRRYLAADERLTKLTLVDSSLAMLTQAAWLLERKARALKIGFVLLLMSVVSLALSATL